MAASVASSVPTTSAVASKTIVNFPWYLYPGVPMSGYYDTDTYTSELQRLMIYIDELFIKLSKNSKNILHITIGAAMEEYWAQPWYFRN